MSQTVTEVRPEPLERDGRQGSGASG